MRRAVPMQKTIEVMAKDTNADDASSAASPEREAMRSPLLSRLSLYLFMAMVVLAPLPDGSAGFIWVQVWTAVCIVIVAFTSYGRMRRADVLVFFALFLLLLAYGVVALFQSVSPGPAPLEIWSQASNLLQTEIPPRSSSVAGTPANFLGRPLLACLLLIAGIAVGKDSRSSGLVLRSIVYSAAVLGSISFIMQLLSVEGFRAFEQGGALTVFFISKNTSATYLGSGLLVAFTLVAPTLVNAPVKLGPSSDASQIAGTKRQFAVALAGMFLVVLLPLTQSRAGVILTFVLAVGAVLLRLPWKRRSMIGAGITILVLFTIMYGISGDAWRSRQAATGLSSGRTEAYAIMAAAISERPWLGYGLGSFSMSFAPFRDERIPGAGIFNIGHSTPLELAFEGGIPLTLAVFACAIAMASILLRAAIRRPQDPYILAGLLVGLLGVLHSSIDFSLQIPGYLIVCFAVVGVGLGRALLPEKKVERRRRVVRN